MEDKRKISAEEVLGFNQYGGPIHDQYVNPTAKTRAIGEPRLDFTFRRKKPNTVEAQVAYAHAGWSMIEPKKLRNVVGQSSGHHIHSQYTINDTFISNRDHDYYDDSEHGSDDEDNNDDRDHGSDDEDNNDDCDHIDDDDNDDESNRVVHGSPTRQSGQGDRVKGVLARIPGGLFDKDEGQGRGDQGGRKPSNMENVDGGRAVGWDKSWGQSSSCTLTRLFPGGPLDCTLLESFDGHVALAVWQGTERGALNCLTGLEQLMKWKLSKGQAADLLVADTGLSHMGRCMFKHVNSPLLSAFVERWHPETNSFHMPFGEMSITLHDVFYILRIPIAGKAVVHKQQGKEAIMQFIADHLSMDLVEVKELWVKVGLTLATIQQKCSQHGIPEQDVARGYLTHLLETTLFVDKTDKFPAELFSLLGNLDTVSEYAWGAAVLAHLYRQLGLASRAYGKQLAGCTTLLEAWIYEYFPKFREPSGVRKELRSCDPCALRWNPGKAPKHNPRCVKDYRRMLDLTTPVEVSWTPFGLDVVNEAWMSTFHGCIRFLDIIEPYMPDRVLRQFAYPQKIPIDPIKPLYSHRSGMKSEDYSVVYPAMESNWDDAESHCLSDRRLGRRAVAPDSVMSNYFEWFFLRTHPRVQNPQFSASDQYSIRYPMMDRTRLRLIAQCLTPALPERRKQFGQHETDEVWLRIDQACEFIRGVLDENPYPTNVGGIRYKPNVGGNKPRFP